MCLVICVYLGFSVYPRTLPPKFLGNKVSTLSPLCQDPPSQVSE